MQAFVQKDPLDNDKVTSAFLLKKKRNEWPDKGKQAAVVMQSFLADIPACRGERSSRVYVHACVRVCE